MPSLQEHHIAFDVEMDRSARHAALMVEIEAEMEARAAYVANVIVKRRARYYRDDPLRLEAVAAGLWCASPETLIATGKTKLNNERRFPSRNFGFGGEVSCINARALIVLGRYQRRVWHEIKKGE
jgi:hypothetical protein